jgi:predicted phage-related endonuclease
LIEHKLFEGAGWKAKGGVDFKTTGMRQGWGEPGGDEVPEWIHTQATWYMGLTGAEWWDIAVLFFAPRREFKIYRIPRNQELIDNLIEAGREFWENHVVPQVPPPLDDSEGSKRLLNHLYPRDTEDLFAATAEVEDFTKCLKIAMESRDAADKTVVLYQNILKDRIGHHQGVITSSGKISWKKNRDSEVTDWKAVVKDYEHQYSIPNEVAQKIIINNTTIKPGSRVFRPFWKKEE